MRDGHIHTPYCPHGTKDTLRSYIEKAITLGYEEMTFTEHAPLPPSFKDPVPDKDSGMRLADVDPYLTEVKKLQSEYKKDIHIQAGFEVDYIEGFEEETMLFLNEYGPYLDDSILSVHFLTVNGRWYCIDYSAEMYKAALKHAGNQKVLYQIYFNTLNRSATADLGSYKPERIGHMTLIKKFHYLFSPPPDWETDALKFLEIIQNSKMELDYNGAGTQKPHCKETYPPRNLAIQASSMGIPLVYGSDAHKSSALKQGYHHLDTSILRP